MQYVQVPDDRMILLQSETKDRIEYETGAEISVDEQTKTVSVEHSDSVKELDATRVLRAISTGFHPETALHLVRNSFTRFERIDIREYTRNTKEFNRQKGRIIGQNGRTRELISELSDAHVTVYDDFVGIIGSMDDVMEARRAILRLLDGTPHARVYEQLEEYQRKKSQSLSLTPS